MSALSRDSIVVGAVNKPELTGTINLKVKSTTMACNAYVYKKTDKTSFKVRYVKDISDTSSYGDVDAETAVFVQVPSGSTMDDVVYVFSGTDAGLLVIGSNDYDEQKKYEVPTIVCKEVYLTSLNSSYDEKNPGSVTLSSLNFVRGD